MRKCSTCQHTKRAEIDRRLAAGEPGSQIARDYELNQSSLHRHRTNCLGLASSNKVMKELARGSAALTCLPTGVDLRSAYSELLARIDRIVDQAEHEGSFKTALAGLGSVRQTLDSLARLAEQEKSAQSERNISAESHVGAAQIAERLIKQFDHEPELKARIAQALLEIEHETLH